MPPDQKRAYSLKSFCDAHDVGRSKIYEEISAGRLKASKVGRRTIITVDNAEAWLKNLKEFGHSTEATPRRPLHEFTGTKRPGKTRQRSLRPRKRSVRGESRDLVSEE